MDHGLTMASLAGKNLEVELCQQDVMGDLQKHLLKAGDIQRVIHRLSIKAFHGERLLYPAGMVLFLRENVEKIRTSHG